MSQSNSWANRLASLHYSSDYQKNTPFRNETCRGFFTNHYRTSYRRHNSAGQTINNNSVFYVNCKVDIWYITDSCFQVPLNPFTVLCFVSRICQYSIPLIQMVVGPARSRRVLLREHSEMEDLPSTAVRIRLQRVGEVNERGLATTFA